MPTSRFREYLTLRAAGISTVEQFASADPNVLYDDAYAVETAHLRLRAQRLHKAHLHAVLAQAGVVLRRRDVEVAVPVADVEYDVDCEWSADGHVYLWGVLRSADDRSTSLQAVDPVLRAGFDDAPLLGDGVSGEPTPEDNPEDCGRQRTEERRHRRDMLWLTGSRRPNDVPKLLERREFGCSHVAPVRDGDGSQ